MNVAIISSRFVATLLEATEDNLLTEVELGKLREALDAYPSAKGFMAWLHGQRLSGSREEIIDWLKTEGGKPHLARLLERGDSIQSSSVRIGDSTISGCISLDAGDVFASTIAKLEGRPTPEDLAAKAQKDAERVVKREKVRALLAEIAQATAAALVRGDGVGIRFQQLEKGNNENRFYYGCKNVSAVQALNSLCDPNWAIEPQPFVIERPNTVVVGATNRDSAVVVTAQALHAEEVQETRAQVVSVGEPKERAVGTRPTIDTPDSFLQWWETEGRAFLDLPGQRPLSLVELRCQQAQASSSKLAT